MRKARAPPPRMRHTDTDSAKVHKICAFSVQKFYNVWHTVINILRPSHQNSAKATREMRLIGPDSGRGVPPLRFFSAIGPKY